MYFTGCLRLSAVTASTRPRKIRIFFFISVNSGLSCTAIPRQYQGKCTANARQMNGNCTGVAREIATMVTWTASQQCGKLRQNTVQSRPITRENLLHSDLITANHGSIAAASRHINDSFTARYRMNCGAFTPSAYITGGTGYGMLFVLERSSSQHL